jgi:hypothetical protein
MEGTDMARQPFDEALMKVMRSTSADLEGNERVIVEVYNYNGGSPSVRVVKETASGKQYKMSNYPLGMVPVIARLMQEVA